MLTEGGCCSNRSAGMRSVLFQEAVHLHFPWLMIAQRTNRMVYCKLSSVEGAGRPDLPQSIMGEVAGMMGEIPFSLITHYIFYEKI